jgi:lysophospholipase L1-like esterase
MAVQPVGRRGALTGAAWASVTTPAQAEERKRTVLAATPIGRMDLKWWRERHEAKLAELRGRPPGVVFYGDSITQQWEHRGPPDWRDYAPIWQRFYGGRNAVNLGFTGDTTASLIWRLRNGQASGIDPRAAVILIGANNLGRVKWGATDTVAGIETIITEARTRLPRTRVVLLGILPSDRSPWASETTVAVNRALAERYPRGHDVIYRDFTALFTRDGRLDRSLFYDPLLNPPAAPLHPTASAMARLAEALEPTLAPLLTA